MTTKPKSGPPQEVVRAHLRYNPETGEFWWSVAVRSKKIKAGDRAARTVNANGYLTIGLLGRLYLAHRLAWVYIYGYWPNGDLDHINGNRADNRIANLREATRSQNNANGKLRCDSTSGVKGVSWDVRRWKAYIDIGRKRHRLGSFKTLEDAIKARRAAEVRIFGKFRYGAPP